MPRTQRCKRKGSKPNARPQTSKDRQDEIKSKDKFKEEDPGNKPSWYFFNEQLADQVSQMSFQQLAGYPIEYDGSTFDVANVVRIHINPSPGVQVSAYYATSLAQNSAINMAGFRLYSKLSAFTGRTQSYAPQDVSTMILAMGEIISMTEFIRRAFGVAYTMNMRNRAYPRAVLEDGMLIDATDLFTNFADYREQFNTLVTLISQLPIPSSCNYFEKCMRLYEKIYLDSPSSMAQTLVPVPHTTWTLDETSYSGGTILKTTQVCSDASFANPGTVQNLSFYLNTLSNMVGALLNSSTLNVVYTDILNYATKVNVEFWRPDYLAPGYMVLPEYNENFMLQMHNATICSMPYETTLVTGAANVTPFNDVYPNPNKNSIYYNPAFYSVGTTGLIARSGNEALIDMMTDNPTVTDRIEVTRYTTITHSTPYTTAGGHKGWIDAAVPDHYIVCVDLQRLTNNLSIHVLTSTVTPEAFFPDLSSLMANIDWCPRIWECNAAYTAYTGRYLGDVNFYTTVDMQYLRKLHDFVGLALYDVQAGPKDSK